MGNFVYNNRSYDTMDEMTLAMDLNQLYKLQEDISDKIYNLFLDHRRDSIYKAVNIASYLTASTGALIAAMSWLGNGTVKSTLLGLGIGLAFGGLGSGILTSVKTSQIKDKEMTIGKLTELLISINKAIEYKESGREIFPELAAKEEEKDFTVHVD